MRTCAFVLSVASVLWSIGLVLTLFDIARNTHGYEMSEAQTIVHTMLDVTLKWRIAVLAAEVCGLYSTLSVSASCGS